MAHVARGILFWKWNEYVFLPGGKIYDRKSFAFFFCRFCKTIHFSSFPFFFPLLWNSLYQRPMVYFPSYFFFVAVIMRFLYIRMVLRMKCLPIKVDLWIRRRITLNVYKNIWMFPVFFIVGIAGCVYTFFLFFPSLSDSENKSVS